MASSLRVPTSYGDANEMRASEGSLVRLNSGSAASVATLDFDLRPYLRAFPILKLFVYNYIAATSASSWLFRISTDGGATFLATGYWVSLLIATSNGGNASENSETATSAILNNAAMSAVSSEAGFAEITIFNPNNASYTAQLMFLANAWTSATHTQTHFGMSSRNTAELVNAVRLLQSSGNLSCNWILAGMSA